MKSNTVNNFEIFFNDIVICYDIDTLKIFEQHLSTFKSEDEKYEFYKYLEAQFELKEINELVLDFELKNFDKYKIKIAGLNQSLILKAEQFEKIKSFVQKRLESNLILSKSKIEKSTIRITPIQIGDQRKSNQILNTLHTELINMKAISSKTTFEQIEQAFNGASKIFPLEEKEQPKIIWRWKNIDLAYLILQLEELGIIFKKSSYDILASEHNYFIKQDLTPICGLKSSKNTLSDRKIKDNDLNKSNMSKIYNMCKNLIMK